MGILFLLLAVLRMGWIAQFLSRAVATGFLFGAAIDVVIGELLKLTGTEVTGSNPIQELRSWLGSWGEAQQTTVVVGVVSLVVVFGLKAIAPRVPGALVLVVGGLLAAAVFDLGARGVALVGDVPSGLPSPELPDGQLMWDNAGTVALAAAALVLIGCSRTAGMRGRSPLSIATRLTSTRSPLLSRPPTWPRESSRGCPSRRACQRVRSTTTPGRKPDWPRSPPVPPSDHERFDLRRGEGYRLDCQRPPVSDCARSAGLCRFHPDWRKNWRPDWTEARVRDRAGLLCHRRGGDDHGAKPPPDHHFSGP